MLDIGQDIHSLSEFKRNTPEFMHQLRETGRPVVLTINGKAELVVQEAQSYQKLLDLIDRLETIEGVKRGLQDVNEGKTKPLAQFRRGDAREAWHTSLNSRAPPKPKFWKPLFGKANTRLRRRINGTAA